MAKSQPPDTTSSVTPLSESATFIQWTSAVIEQLKDLSHQVDALDDVEKACKLDTQGKIAKIDKIINGNGNPETGLSFRLKMAENALEELKKWKEDQEKSENLKNKIIGALIAVIIPALATAIWLGVKAALKG